jgi:hypothetical protein
MRSWRGWSWDDGNFGGSGLEPQCSVKVLHEKCGSTAPLRNFRVAIKELAESNDLPDYSVSLNSDTDVVTFSRR